MQFDPLQKSAFRNRLSEIGFLRSPNFNLDLEILSFIFGRRRLCTQALPAASDRVLNVRERLAELIPEEPALYKPSFVYFSTK